jgi:hypothetical protein
LNCDVKTAKLDGLSRKDLLSSYSFLKQGIDMLNVSLNKSMDEQKDVDEPTDEQAASTMSNSVQSGILNEALAPSQAMEKLNIVSDGHFECAKERLKDARRRATDAFSNKALSIEDRLMHGGKTTYCCDDFGMPRITRTCDHIVSVVS